MIGDKGSKVLPKAPSGVRWGAGSVQEVSWTIEANHGGGYHYSLCKADSAHLDETCFQKTPLAFTGSTQLRWGGRSSPTRLENITGRFVTDTAPRGGVVGELHTGIVVVPAGSMWAKNPIPDYGSAPGLASFDPPCSAEPEACGSMANPILPPKSYDANEKCRCSGEWGPFDMDIVDRVVIPADLTPGEYVLNFRWDCEVRETAMPTFDCRSLAALACATHSPQFTPPPLLPSFPPFSFLITPRAGVESCLAIVRGRYHHCMRE